MHRLKPEPPGLLVVQKSSKIEANDSLCTDPKMETDDGSVHRLGERGLSNVILLIDIRANQKKTSKVIKSLQSSSQFA